MANKCAPTFRVEEVLQQPGNLESDVDVEDIMRLCNHDHGDCQKNVKMIPYGWKSKIIAVNPWLNKTFFELFPALQNSTKKNNNCAGRIYCYSGHCNHVMDSLIHTDTSVSISRRNLSQYWWMNCATKVKKQNTLCLFLYPLFIYRKEYFYFNSTETALF